MDDQAPVIPWIFKDDRRYIDPDPASGTDLNFQIKVRNVQVLLGAASYAAILTIHLLA